jgi:predicted ribosome quality control (RQC) complex YloA/Tae2 family protein
MRNWTRFFAENPNNLYTQGDSGKLSECGEGYFMDGITIYALIRELNEELTGARIEKIHQPAAKDVVFSLRTKAAAKKLLISADRQFPSIHFLSSGKPENPERPPLFCTAIRKRIEGGRILEVRGRGFDRVAEFVIEHFNEIGDKKQFVFIAELMGKNSNLILCEAKNNDLKIVDAIIHVTPDMSRFRSLLPGLHYIEPPKLTKPDFYQFTEEQFSVPNKANLKARENVRELMRAVAGLGPVSAGEVLFRAEKAGYDDKNESWQRAAVVHELKALFEGVVQNTLKPSTGLDELNRPINCAPFPLTSCERYSIYDSMNEAIEHWYREKAARISESALGAKLASVIEVHLDRLRGKLVKITQLEEDSEQHVQLRMYGELLTTYGHMISKGQTEVSLPNFYDNGNLIRIPVDPALSAIENAQKYFRQSSKRKRSIAILHAERETSESDMFYLENALAYTLQSREDQDNLQQIRQELESEGFLKPNRKKGKQKSRTSATKVKQKTLQGEVRKAPDEYVTEDGFRVRIGRNNTQNDRLTLKSSKPHDIWLHVKDVPGSHVVIDTENRQIPNSTLRQAAILAAYFSKAQNSSNVPVDYAEIRNVWKPNGARPGHVLYKNQKTLFVNPDRSEIESLLKQK